MPLKPCRECKKDVSTEAKSCPHCGATKPTKASRQVGAGVGCLAVFLTVVVIGSSLTNTDTPSSTMRAAGATGRASAPAGSDGWSSFATRSEMDGSSGFTAQKEADGPIQKWLGSTTPTLVVRCSENKTKVFVHTETAAQPELGLYDQATVRVRFDEGSPQRQTWTESTNDVALFSPNPIALARRLATAKTFRFQFTPFNAPPAVASFTLTGSQTAIARVAESCGWTL